MDSQRIPGSIRRKRILVITAAAGAALLGIALAQAGGYSRVEVVRLSEFSVSAAPAIKARQSYVFTLSNKSGEPRYVFEQRHDHGGSILLKIAGNRSTVPEETELASDDHDWTLLRLRPLYRRKTSSERSLGLTHELVSIEWRAMELTDREQETYRNPRLKRLYGRVQAVVRRHYPDAAFCFVKDEITFEFNTRVFFHPRRHEDRGMAGTPGTKGTEQGRRSGNDRATEGPAPGRRDGSAVIR